jgi:7-cyano-7-deazaguanine synthase
MDTRKVTSGQSAFDRFVAVAKNELQIPLSFCIFTETLIQKAGKQNENGVIALTKAVVCLSGGLDSCVAAMVTRQTYELALLHVNYRQRTESRELQAFRAIADCLNVSQRLVCDALHFQLIGGSSLTDFAMAVPEAKIQNNDVPTSYVPFRNANLLCIAVSWAEVIGASRVVIGVTETEAPYPDCRRTFIEAFNQVVSLGTKPETNIEVTAPLVGMTKAEIVRKGIELDAPLHLTWSCYRNSDTACGRCHSCALRLKGFAEAGFTDQIPYEHIPDFVTM